jgi:hypothetical protein
MVISILQMQMQMQMQIQMEKLSTPCTPIRHVNKFRG